MNTQSCAEIIENKKKYWKLTISVVFFVGINMLWLRKRKSAKLKSGEPVHQRMVSDLKDEIINFFRSEDIEFTQEDATLLLMYFVVDNGHHHHMFKPLAEKLLPKLPVHTSIDDIVVYIYRKFSEDLLL